MGYMVGGWDGGGKENKHNPPLEMPGVREQGIRINTHVCNQRRYVLSEEMNNETEKSAFDISKNGGAGAVPLRRGMPISTSRAFLTTCERLRNKRNNQVLLHSTIRAEECRQADINNKHDVISCSFSLVIHATLKQALRPFLNSTTPYLYHICGIKLLYQP